MTERLIIRNFAGLDNIDIELGRINIFIGPQASGKSVCAKCLYIFKSFLPSFLASSALGNDWPIFENSFLDSFKDHFPGIWQTDASLFLRYEINGRFIEITNLNNKLTLTYDQLFRRATFDIITGISGLRNKYNQSSSKWKNTSSDFDFLFEEHLLIDEVRNLLYNETGDAIDTTQLFIVASRSFLAALKGASLSFLANSPVADPLLREFLTKYELAKRHHISINKVRIKTIKDLALHILKGDFIIEGDEEFIVGENGRRVRLSSASSGQQEAFALILLLVNLISDDEDTPYQGPYTVYTEEPEAHLFPESQRAMTQLMATIYHESVFSLQYIITTHSPYILASFNNLIYAHQLSEQLKDQPEKLGELYKIIQKNQQLPLIDFRVYGLEKGKAHSLIDEELGLLSAGLLDSASDVTAQQFGALMALDPTMQA